MKIYILQGKVSAFSCIAEIYMIEVNRTICHCFYCISLILHFRNFIQNFNDTVCRCLCDHNHNKYESYHVQGHQNLKCINDNTCQFTSLHAAENDSSSTDGNNDNNYGIHHKLHNRSIPCNNLLCFSKEVVNVFGNSMEFLDLMVFSYECLNYAGCIYIFLYRIVQDIVLIKYFDEMRMCFLCNEDQCTAQKRNYDQEK